MKTAMQIKFAIFLLIGGNLFVYNIAAGQDIHFSQYFASPILANPSAAGSFPGDQRAVINYKDQWSSIASPYTTYAMAFDMKVFKQKLTKGALGLGLVAFSDKAGDTEMGTTQANLMLSYHAKLNDKSALSAGIQGGFAQRTINGSSLKWGNQDDGISGYDPALSSGETTELGNYSYGDFSGGIMWKYSSNQKTMTSNDGVKANLGVALFHINQPQGVFYKAEEEKLYQKIIVHGRASIGMKNTVLAFQPGIFYQHQGPSDELLLGTMIRYRVSEESKYTGFRKESAFSAGGFFRVNDAFVPVIQFEYANYSLGFSYDINVSDLSAASNGKGGMEIYFRYITPNPFRYGKGTSYTPML
ncbi:MAG TPA: type IX secretion system membrane protein PorP/SprF [Flavobacteriales bacterium]|nr:type IX secretion system membrane protein PorP/SprF [Flavobacteriales bacterium]